MARSQSYRCFLYRLTASCLICTFSWGPPLAYAVNDITPDGSTRTTIDRAQNNVRVVNIAPPTQGGVSHNKYTDFNVRQTGAILNNSLEVGVSQLGGALPANPHYSDRTAQIILNEVTSNNRSQLKGYTEIFGDRAEFILANPNGITCAGCGFINTSRLGLVTGTPQLDAIGRLDGLAIGQGDILIEGLGLNAENVRYVDIVTRLAKIQGELIAGQELNIHTGNGRFDYKTRTISSDPNATPTRETTFAVDASALGSMYAGRIKIISNEAGLGVRNDAKLVANLDDLIITAQGDIAYANARAKRDLTLQAKGNITQTKLAQAGNDLRLTADQRIDLSGDSVQASAALDIRGDAVRLHGASKSTLLKLSGRTANLGGKQDLQLAKVRLQAEETATLQSAQGNVAFSQGTASAKRLTITAARDIANEDQILYGKQDLGVTAAGNIQNREKGSLWSKGTFSANAGNGVENKGIVRSGGEMKIVAGNGVINVGDGKNTGVLSSGNALIFDVTGNLDNRGALFAGGNADITLSNTLLNSAHRVSIGGNLRIKAATLDNSDGGEIEVGRNLITVGQLTSVDNSKGKIKGLTAGKTLTLNMGALNNTGGGIVSKGSISLIIDADYELRDTLEAGETLAVQAKELRNHIRLDAGEMIRLTASKGFSNETSAVLASNRDMEITANQSIVNKGEITSGRNLKLEAKGGNLTNEAGAKITGGQGTTALIATGAVINRDKLSSAQDMAITAASLDNYGQIATGRDLTATVTGNLYNRQDKLLFAGRDMTLNMGGALDNNRANIYSRGDMTLRGSSGDNSASASIRNFVGTIEAGGNMTIRTNKLDNLAEEYDPDPRDQYGYNIRRNVRKGTHSYNLKVLQQDEATSTLRAHPAYITSGGNLEIHNTAIRNYSSVISSHNDLTVSGGSLTNETASQDTVNLNRQWGREYFGRTITKEDPQYWSSENPHRGSCHNLGSFGIVGECTPWTPKYKEDYWDTYTTTVHAREQAIFNAKGTVNVNGQSIRNGSVQPLNNRTQNTTYNTATIKEIQATSQIDLTSLLTLPTGEHGLFTLTKPNAGHRYLIESNVAFIDTTQFVGSSYFLERMDVDLDENLRLMGDAVVETRLVERAIGQFTHNPFLGRDVGSSSEQMKRLYDDALGEAERLEQQGMPLTVGVALSPEQVKSLRHDILWLEETEVGGERVLAPRLYLSQMTLDRIETGTGPVISGSEVLLASKEDLGNQGTITARNNIELSSEKSFTNVGAVNAGKALAIDTKQNIINRGGSLYGAESVGLRAGGDIRNESAVEAVHLGKGVGTMHLKDVATIGSGGDLSMDAGGDIVQKGGRLQTAGSAILEAEEDIRFEAIGLGDTRSKPTHHIGEATIGANLLMDSGHDVFLQGKIKAQDNIRIAADRNLTNTGSVDAGKSLVVDVKDNILNLGGSLYGSDLVSLKAGGYIHNESTAETVKSDNNIDSRITSIASIRSGGDMVLDASGDIVLTAAKLKAKGNALLKAGGDIRFGTIALRNKRVDRRYGGFDLRDRTEHVGSEAIFGGDLQMESGRDITLASTHLDVKGGANITAARNFDLLSTTSTHHRERSRDNHITGRTKQASSVLHVGKGLVLTSGWDINIMASKVDVGGDASITAKNSFNLLSSVNTSNESFSRSKKTMFGTNREEYSKNTTSHVGSELDVGGKLELEARQATLVASRIKAKQAEITAELIRLVSEKDLENETSFSDKSGAVTRKIRNKGHVKEEVVEAGIEVQEKLVVNGRTLMEEGLDKGNLLKHLSSQSDLDIEGIKLVKQVANNKEWDDEFTSLSTTGQLLVQAVVAYFTAGAGSALVGAATAASTTAATTAATMTATQAAVNAAVSAAVDSLVREAARRMVEAALTGNPPKFDEKAMLKGAIVSAASGLAAHGAGNTLGEGFAGETLGETAKDFGKIALVSTSNAAVESAVYGGDFKDRWVDNLKTGMIELAGQKLTKDIGDAQDALGGEGSLAKIALHAGVGCGTAAAKGSDCGSGALGSAIAEQLSSTLNNNDVGASKDGGLLFDEDRLILDLASIGAATVTGADVQTIMASAVRTDSYNRRLHPKEAEVLEEELKKLEETLTGEELEKAKYDTIASACSLAKCADGVSEMDPEYKDLRRLQEHGEALARGGSVAYEEMAKYQLEEKGELFQHTWVDSITEAYTKREKGFALAGGVTDLTLGLNTMVIGTISSCATVALCIAGGALSMYSGSQQVIKGADTINKNKNYEYGEGSSVLNSFSIDTHEGHSNPLLEDAGSRVVDVIAVAGTAVKGARLLKDIKNSKLINLAPTVTESKKYVQDLITGKAEDVFKENVLNEGRGMMPSYMTASSRPFYLTPVDRSDPLTSALNTMDSYSKKPQIREVLEQQQP